MPDTPLFPRMALIGVGHIGSSTALAARDAGTVAEIVGWDVDVGHLDRARAIGFIDRAATSAQDAVRDADLVMLAVPVGAMASVADAIAPGLRPGALVSDVGSCKVSVVTDVVPRLPKEARFLAGHPIAGTEHSGPDSGDAQLFQGRYCLLTPTPETDQAALGELAQFWLATGAMVETMSPEHHDRVLGITSHLPHLIAYTIVATATDLEGHLRQEVIKYSAGGFRDFTRIAGSNPVMWRDIFLHNREAVLDLLQRFNEDLTALQRAIRHGEGAVLEDLFTRTRDIRRGVVEAKQD